MNSQTEQSRSMRSAEASIDRNDITSVRRGGKFLTFFLANEEYGIEILKVQEIIGVMSITSVPRTPGFIRGVINLRGKVIPIVELRMKFGMEPLAQTDETCIIVVQVRNVKMGIVVDKVSEVSNIESEQIEPAPAFGADVNTDYILGIGKSQGRVKLLLDIERVLSHQDSFDPDSLAARAQDFHASAATDQGVSYAG